MRVALDTNRYSDFCRGEPEVAEVLETADKVYLPFVTLGELRAGFAGGGAPRQNERVLWEFLMKDGVETLFADEQTTHHYATVFHQLKQQGTPIPTNDMWIAALVLQHNLVLLARDRHFDYLPQIQRR